MKRHDHVRLRHMAEAMDAALRFVKGRNRSDLENNEMLLFALVRAIEIVGEAASKISDEGRAEMPELPWASIVGMRHRLVHAYFEINRDILWTTVTKAVPPLAERLKMLLKDK
jgi:uncharacterized protein with HEPN domain